MVYSYKFDEFVGPVSPGDTPDSLNSSLQNIMRNKK